MLQINYPAKIAGHCGCCTSDIRCPCSDFRRVYGAIKRLIVTITSFLFYRFVIVLFCLYVFVFPKLRLCFYFVGISLCMGDFWQNNYNFLHRFYKTWHADKYIWSLKEVNYRTFWLKIWPGQRYSAGIKFSVVSTSKPQEDFYGFKPSHSKG